jgi:hypothetical protein
MHEAPFACSIGQPEHKRPLITKSHGWDVDFARMSVIGDWRMSRQDGWMRRNHSGIEVQKLRKRDRDLSVGLAAVHIHQKSRTDAFAFSMLSDHRLAIGIRDGCPPGRGHGRGVLLLHIFACLPLLCTRASMFLDRPLFAPESFLN